MYKELLRKHFAATFRAQIREFKDSNDLDFVWLAVDDNQAVFLYENEPNFEDGTWAGGDNLDVGEVPFKISKKEAEYLVFYI